MRLKCANCGFVNFPHETSCKRCKSPLETPLECHNVWRDGKRLVVSATGYLLPKRCLKCNTSDYVDRLELEMSHTPISAYFTILMSFTYWTNVRLYAFFCTSHRRYAEPQMFLRLPNVLVVAGAFSMFAAWTGDIPLLFYGGAAMLGLGILFMKLASGFLKIVKRNKKHIWITGVDQNLLAQLEDFASSKG